MVPGIATVIGRAFVWENATSSIPADGEYTLLDELELHRLPLCVAHGDDALGWVDQLVPGETGLIFTAKIVVSERFNPAGARVFAQLLQRPRGASIKYGSRKADIVDGRLMKAELYEVSVCEVGADPEAATQAQSFRAFATNEEHERVGRNWLTVRDALNRELAARSELPREQRELEELLTQYAQLELTVRERGLLTTEEVPHDAVHEV